MSIKIKTPKLSRNIATALYSIDNTMSRSSLAADKDHTCMSQTGTTVAMLANYHMDTTQFQPVACYLKCVFELNGYIDGNGQVSTKNLKEHNYVDGTGELLEKRYKCLENLDKILKCDQYGLIEECLALDA